MNAARLTYFDIRDDMPDTFATAVSASRGDYREALERVIWTYNQPAEAGPLENFLVLLSAARYLRSIEKDYSSARVDVEAFIASRQLDCSMDELSPGERELVTADVAYVVSDETGRAEEN